MLFQLDAKGTSFAVHAAGFGVSEQVRLPVPGRHQAINAGLAFAAGVCLGADPKVLCRGLKKHPSACAWRTPRWALYPFGMMPTTPMKTRALRPWRPSNKSVSRIVERFVCWGAHGVGGPCKGVYQRLGMEAVKRSFDVVLSGKGRIHGLSIHESSSQIETHFFESWCLIFPNG